MDRRQFGAVLGAAIAAALLPRGSSRREQLERELLSRWPDGERILEVAQRACETAIQEHDGADLDELEDIAFDVTVEQLEREGLWPPRKT